MIKWLNQSRNPTHPGGDREEGESYGGSCGVFGDWVVIGSFTPLTGQQAETHKPQEGPHS